MGKLEGKKIGVAICASCCTFAKTKKYLAELKAEGADIVPIMSFHAQEFNSRFANGKEFVREVEKICNHKVLGTIPEVEPIGPKSLLDLLVIMPCTGNTMAKMAHGITDTTVTMAAKAMLRNEKPVVISFTTNDGLGLNLKNIGALLNVKNIYFVPFGQDNYEKKPASLSADFQRVIPTIELALKSKQIQPIVIDYHK